MSNSNQTTVPHFVAESMCVPGDANICLVPVPRPMPCIVIFVHGVNSEGEWYATAEAALAAGLNTRLGRTDLAPNKYDADDKRNYRKAGRIPVIRFFWGYRAPQDEIADKDKQDPKTHTFKYRIPLKYRIAKLGDPGETRYDYAAYSFWHPDKNDPTARYYWGGGPFQNGTNSLNPFFYPKGFDPHVAGVNIGSRQINAEPDRPLNACPPRGYYAHAAKRLADLIDTIHTKYPDDTVAVVSHSQGTMVAAMAMLYVKKVPDTLFLCNSPYSFDDKLTDDLQFGEDTPTVQSRVRTFFHILDRFKASRRTPTAKQLEGVGAYVEANGELIRWAPSNPDEAGHDNHGRVFIYCCPHDRVMGSTILQSIGWKGVDCALQDDDKPMNRKNPFQLYDGVLYQRQFMRSYKVGDEPDPPFTPSTPRRPTDDLPVWMPASLKMAGMMNEQAGIGKGEKLYVNGPEVPNPVKPEEMKNFNETSVLKDDGSDAMLSDSDDFQYYKELIYEKSTWVPDQEPAGGSPYYSGPRRTHLQTEAEVEQEISQTRAIPTNHSTILQGLNGLLVERVLAYDLPIGRAESFEDQPFWRQLRKMADWLEGDVYYTGETGRVDTPSPPDGLDSETRKVVETDKRRQTQVYGS